MTRRHEKRDAGHAEHSRPGADHAHDNDPTTDPLYRYLDRLWRRGREFLGVRFPILGGAMTWISEAGLVSAISNAGGGPRRDALGAVRPARPRHPGASPVQRGTKDFTTLQLGLVAQVQRGEVTPEEATMKLEEFWIGGLRRAAVEGDVTHGSLMAGQSVGLVRKIRPVSDIIADLVDVALAEIRKHRKTLSD